MMNGQTHIYRKCCLQLIHMYAGIVCNLRDLLLCRSDQRFAVYAAAANNISDVRPVFDSLNWTEESYREYERIGTTGEQLLFCYSASNVRTHSYVHVMEPIDCLMPLWGIYETFYVPMLAGYTQLDK